MRVQLLAIKGNYNVSEKLREGKEKRKKEKKRKEKVTYITSS
jgi:hypothetical protein